MRESEGKEDEDEDISKYKPDEDEDDADLAKYNPATDEEENNNKV